MGIVVDAQRRAVFEDHASRPLDLNRQGLERVSQPADFELLPIKGAGLDRPAIVIRHDLVLFVTPTDEGAFVGELGPWLVAGGRKIGRTPIKRDVEFRIGEARARDDRLVIPRQETLHLAKPRDLDRSEIIFEEPARGFFISRPHARAAPADFPQRVENRAVIARLLDAAKDLAAGLVSDESSEVIVRRPAGNVAPLDWLELSIRKLE